MPFNLKKGEHIGSPLQPLAKLDFVGTEHWHLPLIPYACLQVVYNNECWHAGTRKKERQ